MEFDIIDKHFNWRSEDNTILQNIGDDCAVVINNKDNLLISTDTLVDGVHFASNDHAEDVAHKALMANLSDMAAMGATARYFTLNLILPNYDDVWLKKFSGRLKVLANKHKISLIGGDIVKGGVLAVNITIIGNAKRYLTRAGATVGDGVFVSNTIGGAGLALWQIAHNLKVDPCAWQKLKRPQARTALGIVLNGIASSCIDISDSLSQDLSHILTASGVGANIWSDKLPIFANSSIEHALHSGDDYELCFTAKIAKVKHIKNITQIGVINDSKKLTMDNKPLRIRGYQHF